MSDNMPGRKRNLTIQLVVNGGKVGIGLHSADQIVILAFAFHNVARLTSAEVGWNLLTTPPAD